MEKEIHKLGISAQGLQISFYLSSFMNFRFCSSRILSSELGILYDNTLFNLQIASRYICIHDEENITYFF